MLSLPFDLHEDFSTFCEAANHQHASRRRILCKYVRNAWGKRYIRDPTGTTALWSGQAVRSSEKKSVTKSGSKNFLMRKDI